MVELEQKWKNYGSVAVDMKSDDRWSVRMLGRVLGSLGISLSCASTALLGSKQNFTEYLLSDVFLFVLLVPVLVLASA
jgi:ABC-type transport system involved in cytochrome c biogenesis permease component